MQRLELEKLSRKELQTLAKAFGVKANLSNNDIIALLCDAEVPAQSVAIEPEITEAQQEIIIQTVVAKIEPVVESEVSVAVESADPVSTIMPATEHIPAVGDATDAMVNGLWLHATVKRLNKKTARVVLSETGNEITIKFSELRPASSSEPPKESVSSPQAEVTIPTVDEKEEEIVVTNVEDDVCEPEINDVEENEQNETMDIVEPATEEITDEAKNQKIDVADTFSEEMVEESIQEIIGEAIKPAAVLAAPAVPTPLKKLRVELLAPLSCPRAPPTPVSCARPSIEWNSCTKFSLEDSAVKSGGGPTSRRQERRRQVRRSEMEQLAETMKLEKMEEVAATAVEVTAAADDVASEMSSEAPVVISSAPLVVPTPSVNIASASTACATTSASASATATPAAAAVSTHVTSGAGKEMLPRMNKTQQLRLGAIQKKIVSTEQAPPSSTAFTIAAAAKPSSSASATPAHARHSISAPPSVAGSIRPVGHSTSGANSAARPSLKVATPLSGGVSKTIKNLPSSRASIAGGSVQQQQKTSGLKRKFDSSDRSSSVHSNAPDFKRMHSKQFGSLKSIAECVEQDKHVGVRMTIAMESAMSASKAPPTSSSITNPNHRLSTIAEVAKPAANPFNKVINKSSSGNTPGKAAATPAPLVLSRPTTVNTSANIVKSRTVKSFVSSSSSACGVSASGGKKVTSFLNNENAGPSGVNSFLKSKDLSSGSAKHRSVSMSGSNFGHTQQKLQML